MDAYDGHKALEKEFAGKLGYFNKREIPEELMAKISGFCDAYPDDSMTAFYATSLIDKFYRRRTRERWRRLIVLMGEHLHRKKFLIETFLGYRFYRDEMLLISLFDSRLLWLAMDDYEDGYQKANLIGRYSDQLSGVLLQSAFQRAQAMQPPYGIRAQAGIYQAMDPASQKEIFSYLCEKFWDGSSEAAYRLKWLFPYLNSGYQDQAVALHLSIPNLPESYIGYLVIRASAYFSLENAQKLVRRVRGFESDYFRNRCLLKLHDYLEEGELDALYRRFMDSFSEQTPSSELIHNLYHFSAVRKDMKKEYVVSLALDKISCLDDSRNNIWDQKKYQELSFLVSNLVECHREKAFEIANSIRGGYKRSVMSRLKHHYSVSENFCWLRYAAICY